MSASAPRRERTGEPALWPLVTGALIMIAAVALVSCYGALRLSQALTYHARPPWVLLGPTLLVLVHGAPSSATPSPARGAPRCCSPRSTPSASVMGFIRPSPSTDPGWPTPPPACCNPITLGRTHR